MATQEKRDWLEVYSDEYRERGLYIVGAHYDPTTRTIHVKLKAGMTICIPKERVQGIADASDELLNEIEVSAAGWSFDFPRLDSGISLEGLLSGRFGNDRWEREWASRQLEIQAA